LTPQQIDKIIDGAIKLLMWAISAFAIIQAVQVFYKERSVGKTALGKLKDEHASIKKEFEELKRDHTELSEDIASIQTKYEKLIEKILNNFPFKQ
jgi:predicted  nucleic acid-binding Zn-ribbon protein